MDLPKSRTARQLARLGANFASIDIGNSHTTHNQARRNSQKPCKIEGSLLLLYKSETYVTVKELYLMQLYHQICIHQYWTALNYITHSDTDQQYTRMRCYFHYQHNCFIDYFNDPALDDAVIYAGDVPLQYDEQEGTHRDFIGHPAGYVFLAAIGDHKFLLRHRSTMSHDSCIAI